MISPAGYAVIDLETTGFGGADRIIEVGVVLLRADLSFEGVWETLVQPGRTIPNSFVHRITDRDVADAPRFEDIAADLGAVLRGRVPVAHNADFEKRFFRSEYGRLGVDTKFAEEPWLDTMLLSERFFQVRKLDEALHKAKITNYSAHSALADAEATANLLRYFTREYSISYSGVPRLHVNTIGDARGVQLVQRGGRRANGVEQLPEDGVEGFIARLSRTAPKQGSKQVPGPERYRRVLEETLSGKKASEDDIATLRMTAAADGLSAQDVADVHEGLLKKVAAEAWVDGIVTEGERKEAVALGEALEVDPALVERLLSEPGESAAAPEIALSRGHRVAFTGPLTVARDVWEERVTDMGLIVGDVNEGTRVLIAASTDVQGAKADRARILGVPVVTETEFGRMLAEYTKVVGAPDQPGQQPAERPSRWSHFDWLENVATDSLTAAGVAAAWIDKYPTRPLEEISTLLTADTPVTVQRTGVEKATAKWRQRFPHMLSASVADLEDLPGVGDKRVALLVEAVVLAGLDAANGGPVDEDAAGLSEYVYGDEADDATPEWEGAVDKNPSSTELAEAESALPEVSEAVYELQLVAGWYRLIGSPVEDERALTKLPYLQQIRDDGSAVSALFAACAGELEDACKGNERLMTIAKKRLFGPDTLDELGQQFGVTRERVRQLESGMYSKFLMNNGFSDSISRAIAAKIGSLCSKELMAADLPQLFSECVFGVTYAEFFHTLFHRWEEDGNWLLSPGFDDTARIAIEDHDNGYGAARICDVAAALEVDCDVFLAWLRDAPGLLVLFGDEYVIQDSSHRDRAAAVLSIEGSPMSVEQIVEMMDNKPNPRSVGNAMSMDPRIVRVAHSLFALKEWGMEEFTTTHEWIDKRIDAAGGQISLQELMDAAPEMRISPSSVQTHANSVHYKVEDGMVSHADGAAEIVDADPQDSRDMYMRAGEWHLLITVTGEHLRGSGFQVPRGVPGIYNTEVDSHVDVPSRLGPQPVRVNHLRQFTLGTIRRFLEELESKEGDRVWLRFAADLDDPHAFDVLPARHPLFAAEGSGPGGMRELLDRMGLDPDLAVNPDEAMEAVIAALDLEPNAPRRRVAAIFGHRHQNDLADIVRSL